MEVILVKIVAITFLSSAMLMLALYTLKPIQSKKESFQLF